MRGGSKGGSALFLLLFMVLVFGAGVAAGTAFIAPAKLSIPQEQIIGLMRGGVRDQQEVQVVGDCSGDPPQSVPRTERAVVFADGTSMRVIIFGSPTACE
ncbi:MAG: hypothetical protein HC876_17715 [Chloroflexaceae bacterium]|nr:hypothetical protein [Chloroflexaceae bacterium]NJO07197.1 hypothetical protein [Chloroflexaceae bacterium]